MAAIALIKHQDTGYNINNNNDDNNDSLLTTV